MPKEEITVIHVRGEGASNQGSSNREKVGYLLYSWPLNNSGVGAMDLCVVRKMHIIFDSPQI